MDSDADPSFDDSISNNDFLDSTSLMPTFSMPTLMLSDSMLPLSNSELLEKKNIDQPIPSKSSSRYWTQDEHSRFLEGLEKFGPKNFKDIAALVKTRSVTQVRTHAQKYFVKLEKKRRRLACQEAALKELSEMHQNQKNLLIPTTTEHHGRNGLESPESSSSWQQTQTHSSQDQPTLKYSQTFLNTQPVHQRKRRNMEHSPKKVRQGDFLIQPDFTRIQKLPSISLLMSAFPELDCGSSSSADILLRERVNM